MIPPDECSCMASVKSFKYKLLKVSPPFGVARIVFYLFAVCFERCLVNVGLSVAWQANDPTVVWQANSLTVVWQALGLTAIWKESSLTVVWQANGLTVV